MLVHERVISNPLVHMLALLHSERANVAQAMEAAEPASGSVTSCVGVMTVESLVAITSDPPSWFVFPGDPHATRNPAPTTKSTYRERSIAVYPFRGSNANRDGSQMLDQRSETIRQNRRECSHIEI
jgi:hypothetical protein